MAMFSEQPVGENDEAADAADARTCLIDTIADNLRHHGYYLVHLDPYPTQRVIDLRWAAQIAGRLVGRRVRTYSSAVGAQHKGRVSLMVVPVNVPARRHVQVMLEQLLTAPGTYARIRRAS